ncbi:MAG: hypothetical protein EOP48_00595 [Sphingobacteriales bacterium]|nr:MAG: hypothetical protein EOP48_00595 [Sphingobacteriales bacterium]
MAIHIIFPQDPTTAFLRPVVEQAIRAGATQDQVVLYELEPNDDSHSVCKEALRNIAEGSTIVFLGHGSSTSLSGAKGAGYHMREFITSNDRHLFNGKIVVLFSCRSNDFIKRLDNNFISAIGFGDMPTDWEEIMSAREFEIGSYLGITEDLIVTFREALIRIFSTSLVQSIRESKTAGELSLLIKLLLNKELTNASYEARKTGNYALCDLLYEMKHEKVIEGNNSEMRIT